MTLSFLHVSSKKSCLWRHFTYHLKAHTISNKLITKVSAQKKGESYDSYKYLFRFRWFQVGSSREQWLLDLYKVLVKQGGQAMWLCTHIQNKGNGYDQQKIKAINLSVQRKCAMGPRMHKRLSEHHIGVRSRQSGMYFNTPPHKDIHN